MMKENRNREESEIVSWSLRKIEKYLIANEICLSYLKEAKSGEKGQSNRRAPMLIRQRLCTLSYTKKSWKEEFLRLEKQVSENSCKAEKEKLLLMTFSSFNKKKERDLHKLESKNSYRQASENKKNKKYWKIIIKARKQWKHVIEVL